MGGGEGHVPRRIPAHLLGVTSTRVPFPKVSLFPRMLAAQRYKAESPGWEAEMCRERCLALLLWKTANLPSSFFSKTELIDIRNARLFVGYFLYHWK